MQTTSPNKSRKFRVTNRTVLRIRNPFAKSNQAENRQPNQTGQKEAPKPRYTQIYAKHKRIRPLPSYLVKMRSHLDKWPYGIGKFVYAQATKPLRLWLTQPIALAADIVVGPLAFLSPAKARANNYLQMGIGLVFVAAFIQIFLHGKIPGLDPISSGFLARAQIATIIQYISIWAPPIFGYTACCLILASFRYRMRRSYLSWVTAKLKEIPAFDSGVEFWLGEKRTGARLALQDLHTGISIFGSVGSGKTQALMNPLLDQIFAQLNLPEPTEGEKRDPLFRETADFKLWEKDPRQKVGGLILDRKGDFVDYVIYTMLRHGRPLTDLIIIDPEIELWRYNLLDTSLPKTTYAQYNSVRLAEMQKIAAGSQPAGNEKFWDEASRDTVAMFLHILVILKPRHTIGLHHLARLVLKDELCQDYCDRAEQKTRQRYRNNEIGLDEFNADMEAVTAIQNKWIKGESEKIKPTLKLTVTQLLGEFAANPKLQRIFCQNTNFDFKKVINEGKIVLFRGGDTPIATCKKICVALKTDFQDWMIKRAGSNAQAAGVQTTRSLLFYVDEYQEFVTPKDSEFLAISRSAKTIPVVATQGVTSYKNAFQGNDVQTHNLLQGLTTNAFLKTNDKETAQYGEDLAGEIEEYKERETVSSAGLLDQTLHASAHGAKEQEITLESKDYKKRYRLQDYMHLTTQDGYSSRTGPYYSEAIIIHYHERDNKRKQGRAYKTKLRHVYDIDKKYDKDLKSGKVARNTLAFNTVMYDRIAQITTHHLFYPRINQAIMQETTNRDNFLAAIESRRRNENRATQDQRQAAHDQEQRQQAYDKSLPEIIAAAYSPEALNTGSDAGHLPMEDYDLKAYQEWPNELLEGLKQLYEIESAKIRRGEIDYPQLQRQSQREIDRVLEIIETEYRRIRIEINRRALAEATAKITAAFGDHPVFLFKADPRQLDAQRAKSNRLSDQNTNLKYANLPEVVQAVAKAQTGIDLKEPLDTHLDVSKTAGPKEFVTEFPPIN
jgi:TraM recognition site of TraD and TraG